jgi:hypothetical protein
MGGESVPLEPVRVGHVAAPVQPLVTSSCPSELRGQ